MKKLNSGDFFGVTDQKLEGNGLIFTNTTYIHEYVDWHHHENAYFTFLLAGKMIEGDKKGEKQCNVGSLIFHNEEEMHYNIKSSDYTRGMHIELLPSWFQINGGGLKNIEGSFEISDVNLKIIFHKILKETKNVDDLTLLGIENLVVNALGQLFSAQKIDSVYVPDWVKLVDELLKDNYLNPYSLTEIANILGIHPVHLSRSFTKYFGCTLANYIRKIRVERALSELLGSKNTFSYIAHDCGFADQSHMIRCFKEFANTTPAQFRKLLRN